MAILSNGSFLAILTNKTINSQKFVFFLWQLSKLLKDNEWFGFKDVLILMDNWSIHKSGEAQAKLLKLNHKIMYLSAYTPKLAPIENWFRTLKSILCKENKENIKNLNNKSNYEVILKAMRNLKSFMIINLFTKMKEFINQNN